MSQLEKAGNFALFFNFIFTVLYVLITWDGTGEITFSIPPEVPFGSDRIYIINGGTIVLIIMIVMLVIVGATGVQIFGSGLQDSAANFISILLIKIIVYLMLTVFTYALLALMSTLGLIIYWILTFLFIIGLTENMFEKG